MAIGQRIRERLAELKKTPAWLARQASRPGKVLHPSALSALMTRDSTRTIFAQEIADALDVEVNWLMTGEGRKEPRPDTNLSREAERIAKRMDDLPPKVRVPLYEELIKVLDIAARQQEPIDLSLALRIKDATAEGIRAERNAARRKQRVKNAKAAKTSPKKRASARHRSTQSSLTRGAGH